ncbi:MAG TPA: hypothetical protein VFH95_05095 [Candidatus Kapabacteria bacterium]|nr:hypothetical protein [Candidatus Kapabacteria bacterium]
MILLLFGLAVAWHSTTHWIWKRPIIRGLFWFVSILSVFASATQLFPWFLFDAGSLRATLLVLSCILLPMLVVLATRLLKRGGQVTHGSESSMQIGKELKN